VFAVVALSAINFSALADQALTNLPKNVIIHVENGKLSINQPLPYVISMPTSWESKSAQSANNGLRNLIVLIQIKMCRISPTFIPIELLP